MSTPMTQCSLGGYVYPYNPVQNQNPRVRAVLSTDTLMGRYHTDCGTHPSRQDINQTWPTMDADFFEALNAKALAGGVLSYTHDDGVVYTVIATAPTFQNKTPGGDAYQQVALKLLVVSSP